MESHQAGQKDALVEVRVEKDCLEAAHRPRGSPAHRRGCFKCAVALAVVMGLVIVALVAGFILYFFMFTTASRDQDSSASNAQEKFNITCEGKKSYEEGRYVIFTANKTANYLIYGEVKNANSEEVTLIETWKKKNTIINSKKESDLIFLEKVRLFSGTSIIIDFKSTNPPSCYFLFYKL